MECILLKTGSNLVGPVEYLTGSPEGEPRNEVIIITCCCTIRVTPYRRYLSIVSDTKQLSGRQFIIMKIYTCKCMSYLDSPLESPNDLALVEDSPPETAPRRNHPAMKYNIVAIL